MERSEDLFVRDKVLFILSLACAALSLLSCEADDGGAGDDDSSGRVSYRIIGVEVESHVTYKVANPAFPFLTGDLWPCAWGQDGRLYVANGDGVGFGVVWGDIVFSVLEGFPPHMAGYTPPLAVGEVIAGKWGPETRKVSRKPTGMTCRDGAIYLFFQNLKNVLSGNEFGDAPHASISVTRDGGLTWHYDRSKPMFTDHVFTTGFFLDFGKCQEYAIDDSVYIYGLDYNWRFSNNFSQFNLYLARVERGSILGREAWEFFAGFHDGRPAWSPDIDFKVAVIEDETLYCGYQSGIAQGSVIYIPQLNRYLYSTWAECAWIFYEARNPWGPWTKVTTIDWNEHGLDEGQFGGYATVIPTTFLDADGRGGWIVSSLLGLFDNRYYNFGMRRFRLKVGEGPEG